MTILREICKAKRRRFAPLSFLAAFRAFVLVWGDIQGSSRQETYVLPRWIYARYICFKVPDSTSAVHPFGSITSPFSSQLYHTLLSSLFLIDLLFFFLVVIYLWGRDGKKKGTHVGVMARISALDLKQRFSVEDGNSIRVLQKMKKERNKKIKLKGKWKMFFDIEIGWLEIRMAHDFASF